MNIPAIAKTLVSKLTAATNALCVSLGCALISHCTLPDVRVGTQPDPALAEARNADAPKDSAARTEDAGPKESKSAKPADDSPQRAGSESQEPSKPAQPNMQAKPAAGTSPVLRRPQGKAEAAPEQEAAATLEIRGEVAVEIAVKVVTAVRPVVQLCAAAMQC